MLRLTLVLGTWARDGRWSPTAPPRTVRALWMPLPKVVFSITLAAVQGTARLASDGLAEEIARVGGHDGALV